MTIKFLKTIGSFLIVGMFLFLAFGSGSSEKKIKIDINDKQALEDYIQGKWSFEKHTGDINHTWRFRLEIKGNKLRIWRCWNNMDDPFDMSGGYEEFNFTLGSPTRDIDGYHARNLEFAVFDKTNNFGGVYNSLMPIWIVSDDHWDTPVLRCASGIPTCDRDEFQSSGNNINDNDDNSYPTTSESSNSPSNNYDDNSNETQTDNSGNYSTGGAENSESSEEELNAKNSLYENNDNQITTTNNLKAIELIEKYYQDLASSSFDAYKWFDESVLQFITKKNISPNEINKLQKKNTEFVGGISKINLGTFTLNRTENNIKYWQFENSFTCYRTSKKKFQSCKILIEVGINTKKNKIESYKELKVDELRFTGENPN